MIKSLLLLSIIAVGLTVHGQTTAPAIKAKELTASQIPAGIKYRGQLAFCRQWTDVLGENYLIGSIGNPVLTQSAKNNPVVSEDAYSQFIFATHFIKTDTGYRLLWKMEDGVKNCSFDMTTAFLKGSTSVTDLDNNGTAETTVVYGLSCRSDVSPSDMKLIMHEGTKKYALRGLMAFPASEEEQKKLPLIKEFNLEKVKLPAKDSEGYWWAMEGRYVNEKDFAGAPPAFLTQARALWRRYFDESKAIGD